MSRWARDGVLDPSDWRRKWYGVVAADSKNKNGKLRLLYEASPMAFIAEQSEGSATDGVNRILDIVPRTLHQRTPLVIGSREDVGFVADAIRHAQARVGGGTAAQPIA